MPVCEHFMISFADLDRTREVILYCTPASTLRKTDDPTSPRLSLFNFASRPEQIVEPIQIYAYKVSPG